MAATDYNWINDWAIEDKHANVVRKRLVLKVAGSAALAETLPPEWNTVPDVGSNFKYIPEDAITVPEPKNAQAEFKEFLTGCASTPNYNIRADFAKFNRDKFGIEDAETRALGVAIRNYIATDAGSFDYGGLDIDGLPITGSDTHTFDTLNFFRILSDEGDPEKTIDEFVVEGEFVQRPLPSKPGAIYYQKTVVQDYELYHIGRAILDALPMSVVAKHMRQAAQDLDDTPRYGTGFYKLLYDHIWYDTTNSRLYFTAQALGTQFGGNEGQYALRFKLYSFSDLYHIIQVFAEKIYSAFARSMTASFSFTSLKDYQPGTACPLDVWHFNKCAGSETPAQDVGGGLNRNLLLFPGIVTYGESDTRVGGLLYNGPDNGGKDNTLDRDDLTAWEFISDMTIGSMAKAKFIQSSDSSLTLRFLQHYESYTGRTFTLADIVFDDHDAEQPICSFVESEFTVASVTASLRQRRGDDYGEHTVRQPQKSASEKTGTIKLMFDNLPIVGAEGDWQQISGGATLDTNQSQGVHAAAIMRMPYLWKIVAMADSLPGFSNPVPCRVLPSATYSHWGPSPTYHEYPNIDVDLPMPGSGYDWKNDFFKPMRAACSYLQQTAGMLYGSAKSGLTMYGSAKIIKLGLTLIAEKVPLAAIGDNYNVDLSTLIASDEVDASDLPDNLFLKSIKKSETVNSVECEFIGLPY